MKRIYLLIILVVGCVMLSAQQDPFTNRIPCHLKASRVGTNSVELIWENVVEAVSYEVYKILYIRLLKKIALQWKG